MGPPERPPLRSRLPNDATQADYALADAIDDLRVDVLSELHRVDTNTTGELRSTRVLQYTILTAVLSLVGLIVVAVL